jgi:hypothetical protein
MPTATFYPLNTLYLTHPRPQSPNARWRVIHFFFSPLTPFFCSQYLHSPQMRLEGVTLAADTLPRCKCETEMVHLHSESPTCDAPGVSSRLFAPLSDLFFFLSISHLMHFQLSLATNDSGVTPPPLSERLHSTQARATSLSLAPNARRRGFLSTPTRDTPTPPSFQMRSRRGPLFAAGPHPPPYRCHPQINACEKRQVPLRSLAYRRRSPCPSLRYR